MALNTQSALELGSSLFQEIQNIEPENFDSVIITYFKTIGFEIIDNKAIKPHSESILSNSIIYPVDNLVEIPHFLDEDMSIKSHLKKFIEIENEFSFVIILDKEKIYYFDSDLTKIVDFSLSKETLSTLLSLIQKRQKYDNKSLRRHFGLNSPLYFLLSKKLIEQFRDSEEIFKSWEKKFQHLYWAEDLTYDLFIRHTYLLILSRSILVSVFFPDLIEDSLTLKEINDDFAKKSITTDFSEFFNWLDKGKPILIKVQKLFREAQFEKSDVFSPIYQELITKGERHSLGEFYTLPEMAKLMVERVYRINEMVLDPTCGSGTFLVEIINFIENSSDDIDVKIKAFNRIYGFDINPIAIFISKVNLLILLKNYLNNPIKLNLIQFDSLFGIPDHLKHIFKLKNKFDLIIGNPPWLPLNSIKSKKIKENVKKLADELEIKPDPQQITKLELSTLFFNQTSRHFLKENGRIFFILSRGVMSNDHANKFRYFKGFKNIKIWLFDRDLYKVHSICLLAEKSEEGVARFNIPVKNFSCTFKSGVWHFSEISEESYTPYEVLEDEMYRNQDKILVGRAKRLIPKQVFNRLLPRGPSYYTDKFYQGAILSPRNLVFVDILEYKDDLILIDANKNVLKRAKKTWNYIPYESKYIESKYIFKIVKSTDLVPFLVLKYDTVFLPINRVNFEFDLQPHEKANIHFNFLCNEFKKNQKPGAQINDLWKNINHLSKLTNPHQRGKFKVVYNQSGSILKSAVVKGNYIVDSTLYYTSSNSLSECYFLSGIFNAPILSEDLKEIAATGANGKVRHLHKRPLHYQIPKFNSQNKLYSEVTEFSQHMEFKIKQFIKANIKKFVEITQTKINKIVIENLDKIEDFLLQSFALRRQMVQNTIFKHFENDFDTLNELVFNILERK